MVALHLKVVVFAIVKKIKPLKLKQKEIQAKYQAIAAQRKANKEKAAVKA